MNLFRRKLFHIIVLAMTIFYALTSVCFADETLIGQDSFTGAELSEIIADEYDYFMTPLKQFDYYSYNGSESIVNYGNQLNGNVKAVYNSLVSLSINKRILNVFLTTPIVFYTATENPTESELSVPKDAIKKMTQTAIDAYNRDFPENFWLDIPSSEFRYSFSGEKENGRYKWTITLLTYYAAVASTCSSQLDVYQEAFESAVNNFKVQGSTTYDKVKSIYEQLCRNVVYLEEGLCHESYGALVSKKAVCSGYAQAFKVICDRENIPCVLISGKAMNNAGVTENHMWNAVKMEDGRWYCLDATWGDQNPICYEFMLTGTQTQIAFSGNKQFGSTHFASGDFSATGIYEFDYPNLSSYAYDPNKEIVTPVPTATPKPTATSIPVENPENGDANRDGVINASDALIVLKVAAKLLPDDEHYKFGDVNADGTYSADDALTILKISAKLI